MTLPVALTLGDPAGIGGEIALQAYRKLGKSLCFFVIGDLGHLRAIGQAWQVEAVGISDPREASAITARGLPVLDVPLPKRVTPGVPDPANASSVVETIRLGVELVRTGNALALCTNPINKKALKDGAGFAFPGHTEFLAHLAGARRPVMMLASPQLRVIPTTIHIPLSKVPTQLTAELLEETLRVADEGLRQDFGIEVPRIAVAGLNPHAGEGGTTGDAETRLIGPVVEALREEGMNIAGPLPADTMFHPAARARYDVAVCMYHDQALIPIKTLDFDRGVNVTLGLDFVRTSPDHGTAYDIAGLGLADPTSLVEALLLARDTGLRRLQAA